MAGLFRHLLAGPRPDLFLAASIHGCMMVYIMFRIVKSRSIAAQLTWRFFQGFWITSGMSCLCIVCVLGAFCQHLSACSIALPLCITCGWCSLLASNMWLVLAHQKPHIVNPSCCTSFQAHPCSSSYSYSYLGSWPFCNSCGSLFVPFSVRSPPRFPLVFFGVPLCPSPVFFLCSCCYL